MSNKTVHTQLVGKIEVIGGYLDAMLCMDRDRPDEAMIHFWSNDANSTNKPGAILFDGVVRPDGRIDLSSRLRYSIDNGGALVVAPFGDQVPRGSMTASIWPKNKSTYIGTWTTADGVQRSVEFGPTPAGPKIKPRRCRTWNDYKKWVSSVSEDNHIGLFRGHGSNEFTLSTSLHRTGTTRLERFTSEALTEFTAHAENVLGRRIDLNDPRDYASSMALAQHHGLPTPLMDWTVSPYIAAFFAFSDALEVGFSRPGVTHVRVYGVTNKLVNAFSPALISLPFFRPYVSFLKVSALHNPRLYAQQGRFLVTNVSNLESFLTYVGVSQGEDVLVAADIPIAVAIEAMRDLQFMGLTAAALFPGLDGVCRMMKHAVLINSRKGSINFPVG